MKDLQIEQEEKPETIILKQSTNNKDVIQSYILTTARYDFSVYEKRILYRIVECFQSELAGEKLDKDFSIIRKSDDSIDIVIPVSSLLLDDEDENYTRIKKAFKSLQKKLIEYEDKSRWMSIALIERPEVLKYDRNVRFRLHYMVYKALLDFSKGYRRYELETTMSFRSVYAMRFYELMSGQKEPLTFKIENLRAMLQLENKHKPIRNFVRYVIEPAKKELDAKSPYSFDYKMEYEKERKQSGRKKITGITFTPVYHSENRDELLAERDERRIFDLSKVLLPEERYFFSSLGFTEEELKSKHYDLVLDIARARRRGEWIIHDHLLSKSKEASDPKAYALHSLRNGLEKYEERVMEQQQGKSSAKEQLESKERKDRISISSFLSTMLNLSGETLEKTTDLIMKKGGSDYLDELFTSCKRNMRKIRAKLVR